MLDYLINDDWIDFFEIVFYSSADRSLVFLSIGNFSGDGFQIGAGNGMDVSNVVLPVFPFTEFESTHL